MSTYIIGDVQGCYQELQALLALIQFDPLKDQLGFVGDLVNRGPNSLEVLRFIKSLPSTKIVLGNHDLYLLIIGYDLVSPDTYEHTLHAVLRAPDKIELLEWMRKHPLIYYEENENALLVHAGIPPQWSIRESIQRANEVSSTLCSPHYKNHLTYLLGNQSTQWRDNTLNNQDRLCYINNAFTRMRFCDVQGTLEFARTNTTDANKFKPWFKWRDFQKDNTDIFFGHWAALNGKCDTPRCYALDTGCAWGRQLTAINLKTKERFSVACDSSLRI
ncbi:symmetrical bis(5'-nucleosyl)-tetraphosphatase [Coxiella endosymbiont of Amblyomma nuttalli]|uniref:symmetrical bis(5'-nucleosyl)-tetraphosphatase n=1 Tax=Coxiella endosymbiont of Amblyomma nuttalli TaxID=2749996 RepID=UPI001BABAD4B|nr:symmetrical bis(5'-nucleosyl)-tetraphosphatase [Coxiella endosymbiont of Amblyomma nuttalli]QTS83588.1 symmetrical bis(5'-nucleosyl)-tetraphosphatase [Coxiella endosymbiont of Amblyomma nuttalli]